MVDNLVLIPNNSFNSLINPAANYRPLSEIILSGSPYNCHTLSLNNCASPSTVVFSVVGTKCAIFVNQSTTTTMLSYPMAKGSFVMKSADICVYALSGTEFGISFPAGCSVQFLFLWQVLHPSIYLFTSIVTSGHQKFLITISAIFHCPSCPSIGML